MTELSAGCQPLDPDGKINALQREILRLSPWESAYAPCNTSPTLAWVTAREHHSPGDDS